MVSVGRRARDALSSVRDRVPSLGRFSVSLALGVLAWSLCSPAGAASSPPGPRILRIGLQESAFPFSYLDHAGQPQGYSREICLRALDLVQKARTTESAVPEYKIEVVSVTSGTRLSMLLAHRIDLECGSTTHTSAREKLNIGFSPTIFVSGVTALVRRDPAMPVIRFEDVLARAAVVPRESVQRYLVTTEGSTSIRHLRDVVQDRGVAVRYGQTHEDSFQRLFEDPDAVAFVMDEALLRGRLALADSAVRERFEVLKGAITPSAIEHYAIMYRKSDAAFEKALLAAMDELFRSGEIERIYQRWFMAPIPSYRSSRGPEGRAAMLTLGLPLSDALRQLFRFPRSAPFEESR